MELMKAALPYLNDQLEWEDDRKEFAKEKKAVMKDLGKAATLLWSHCHITLRTKMEADKDFQSNPKIQSDAGEMYRIIAKISNGANSVQNPALTAVELSYNLYFIRGAEYNGLAEYGEAFYHRSDVAERAGWCFASEELRDICIKEYTPWHVAIN